tara:strand:- start:2026 stop:2253 length:228 start_codon:yes stop_codon:yes gene_type:complete
MERWLRNRATAIAIEFSNNTTDGLRALEEFAKYTGRESAEDVLYFILKNVAEHTKYCKDNPEIASQINELRCRIE